MPNDLYTFSVPAFLRGHAVLSELMRKGEAHARDYKITPSALLTARLFPDMFPLTGQVQAACDTAKRATGRLVGVERALRTMKLPLKNCARGSNERQSLSGNFRLMRSATPIRARLS
jgi:hypothetical protein